MKIKDKLKLIVDNEEVYFSVDFILEQLHKQNLMNENNLEVVNASDLKKKNDEIKNELYKKYGI